MGDNKKIVWSVAVWIDINWFQSGERNVQNNNRMVLCLLDHEALPVSIKYKDVTLSSSLIVMFHNIFMFKEEQDKDVLYLL